ncbi:MAG: phage tail protein [Bdellovibrionales bacterium]
MASIVLQSVGSAIGNALIPGLGGILLGSLGRSVGGLIDAKLGLGTHIEGPRLTNLAAQDSRYGVGIPIVYGNLRVAGNVIWASDLIETRHEDNSGGGKGGGSSVSATTYTYSVHCAVALALGPIGGIATIWADSKVIYRNGVWNNAAASADAPLIRTLLYENVGVADALTIYTGTATQNPDPFMESILGGGNVPAYRGLAYVVFENLQLANFGNRIPNLTFEIIPAPESSAPAWLGGMDAHVSQRTQTVVGAGMMPLALAGANSGSVASVVAGGYVASGSAAQFAAVTLDVSGNVPVETARALSASFVISSPPSDCAWAASPDGRFVACSLQSSASPTHKFALYDAATKTFGPITALNLAMSAGIKKLAWLDAQHVVIDDVSGGARGLRALARAGMGLVDLGFFDVWGAGSAATRLPLSGAQFTPLADGLVVYATDNATGTYFSTLYACPLAWRNNALAAGAPYTVVSGISTGSGSGPHASFAQTNYDEWTLCFGTVTDFSLMSFAPSASGAAVTRPWQTFTPSFGVGTTQFPVVLGTGLTIAQRGVYDSAYRLSEVTLGAGSFALAQDGALVTGGIALMDAFAAMPLDNARILLMGAGGFNSNLGQVGIIQKGSGGNGLDHIVADILNRAGCAAGDYDVAALAGIDARGYALQEPMAARAALEPLQVYAPFDLVERGGKLVAVPRHAEADLALPSGEGRAAPEGKDQPPIRAVLRAQEMDLPREVDLEYIDPSRNFEVNCQRARLASATAARSARKISLPMACEAGTAKRLAEERLYAAWAEREIVKVRVSRRWLALDPGDVLDVGDGGPLLRVTGVNAGRGVVEVEGYPVGAASLPDTSGAARAADAGSSPSSSASSDAVAEIGALALIDAPLLHTGDDQPGVYAAVIGAAGWKGASLWRSADGVSFSSVAALPVAATGGIAASVLAAGSADYMDRASFVQAQLAYGELASCSESELLSGANAAWLGGEIIQFQTATLAGPGLYTLSNLLRGRRGTEGAAFGHVLGEPFVLLQSASVAFVPAQMTARGAAFAFRALAAGQSLGDAQDTSFTYGFATLRPLSPANVAGARASGAGSDLTFTWKRRARLNAEWVDYVDVPLDEPLELYDVEIMNGAIVARTFSSLASASATYTAAQQAADWPSGIPASFTVRVYQISSRYGRGKAAEAVV